MWKSDGYPRSPEYSSWVAHKDSKKKFRREIKRVQRAYEREEINRILNTSECDLNHFWRIVQRHRKHDQAKTFAVNNSAGKTVHVGLDSTKRVFVAYFDVSKAFDGVWIDGLFYQMRMMGIVGKVWRLLYLSYQNFWCKVRINGQYSDWYKMECGIHQGGYLSLLKYTAFIDPLLREIEESGIGCCISGIPTSPLGYADDIAAACLTKAKIDYMYSEWYMPTP